MVDIQPVTKLEIGFGPLTEVKRYVRASTVNRSNLGLYQMRSGSKT